MVRMLRIVVIEGCDMLLMRGDVIRERLDEDGYEVGELRDFWLKGGMMVEIKEIFGGVMRI